jgi:LPXTG-motif cell wall-anchored protein
VLFWDQLPTALAWAGIALLIGAGLLVVKAETWNEKAAPEGAA